MTQYVPRSFLTIDDIRKYYLHNIEQYGIDAPRTMGYRTGPIDDRLIRHMLPTQVPESYSVLDVGCGLGQILPILASTFPESKLHRLVGLDLVEEFISSCVQQFPEHHFLSLDFLEWESSEQFDLVIAAGVLVTRISDFESYLEKCIRKMVAASQYWIGFNVIGSCGANYTAKHLATISEEKLRVLLSQFPEVTWEIVSKEVFPGAEDIFVRGLKIFS